MDNVSSHKTALIRNWFAKRPRWHAHYTPTSASWINQVERFFALLTETRSGEARIAPQQSPKPPSPPTSKPTTPGQSRSTGRKPPPTSSLPSNASAKRTSQPLTSSSAWIEAESRAWSCDSPPGSFTRNDRALECPPAPGRVSSAGDERCAVG
ncbi:MAG TPA: transposase [Roseomonas sp.]